MRRLGRLSSARATASASVLDHAPACKRSCAHSRLLERVAALPSHRPPRVRAGGWQAIARCLGARCTHDAYARVLGVCEVHQLVCRLM